ncbi:glutamate--tRNA ligase [Amedibacillus dolichus]|uniref:Glutamate--tRNA ligase n=1 Tax=Amedibacillus dolichus TaxID=31971 RepID=A0A415PCS3_9FIRM|nr:glutamate--tRNA ligase [Amedibacillus dolichus]RHM10551.1 glutamate--tRNA ligase [Amedibacillus dolichus]
MKKVRTRFAPSPTGYMHIGNLRTALFEYLIAKHEDGDFILRIEDTDQERLVEGAVDIIYDTMKAVGLNHDEGPDIGGDFGPYVQSERLSMYKGYADQLVELGGAHYCFCSEEEIEAQRKEAESLGISFKYDDPCKHISIEEARKRIADGEKYVVRQTIKANGETYFDDEVYGRIEVDNATLDESVLLKSDGFPTYNFANIIDDHQMQISHVVRGNEYLSSTPKYNLIYQAYGWDIPTYVHVPPVMKDEQHKLSKRNGDASFQDLVKKGYLPEAILNYIALLGWAPESEQEIYSLEELIKVFDIKRISKSPAIFDIDKLTWMNGMYLRAMSEEKFYETVKPYIEEAIKRPVDQMAVARILQPRTDVLSGIVESLDFIDVLPEYDNAMYIHKKMKTTYEIALKALKASKEALEALNDWSSEEKLHDVLLALPAQMEMKNGQILWPVRCAITGKQFTPGGAIEIAYILGKEETLARIQIGIEKLEKEVA